jgi:hypothetical protein
MIERLLDVIALTATVVASRPNGRVSRIVAGIGENIEMRRTD